jgi:peptidoglycan/xylan/chitin deacetylase (PgdA/CDA1 family)
MAIMGTGVGTRLAQFVPLFRKLRPERATVAACLDRTGLANRALSRRRGASWLPVLTYHRVAEPAEANLLDDGVIDVTPAEFDRQLAFIAQRFTPLCIADLCAFVVSRKPLPARPVLVTFDDGYRDNYEVALPLLRKHGVTAVFFIATDYVAHRKLFWWDRISYVVRGSRRDRLILEYPRHEEIQMRGAAARVAAVRRLQRVVKDTRGLDLCRFLEHLEHACDVAVPPAVQRRLVEDTVMTWEHVRALRRAGMDVQSHTHTHRVLDTLEPTDAVAELRASRALLERILGEPVRAVSYPVGRPVRGTPHLVRAVREAGYDLGFCNSGGINKAASFDALGIKRISMDRDLAGPVFRATLAFPRLARES